MCPYINEGMNIDGPYYYCNAAALGVKLSAKELEGIGCTEEQRNVCKRFMEMIMGYVMLPEPVETNTNVIIKLSRDEKTLQKCG
ncbi:hypothetical protein Desaci_2414 [Desulfosporosinus acidiphilus SJ4]|uniref:Uncharacterized protein n=1 Tax=Desulfosporosinus acidiphilus (strain DSM 22704 / JCM 16185 / SJ4) TaxID=646529 RepID=I4D6E2_DESAJ|nr:hypothetical protein [Desulfosporosinus acidiphilus]AFM41366.1 hypothetical protein Desaci_2414 [Desulfosporosinus acidiphilus SJ4]